MPRKPYNVELLQTLIDWAGGDASFRDATGIRIPDQRHYVNGTKSISLKRLRRAAEQVFGTPPAFVPEVERQPLPDSLPGSLNGKPGLYAFFSSSGSLVYFGKATNLYAEINQTLKRNTPSILFRGTTKTQHKFRDVTKFYSAYHVPRGDSDFRHDVEALVLRAVLNDTFNVRVGYFKRQR